VEPCWATRSHEAGEVAGSALVDVAFAM
jgi:hypothetical protein